MLFNSWGYLLFLLAAVPAHWLLSHRARIYLLSGSSILFYATWRWDFALLMIFSALVDYTSALRIQQSQNPAVRRAWLLVSLVINIGLLCVFKYAYFLSDGFVTAGGWLGYETTGIRDRGLEIILPLGISFYTFQTISYTIDVFRRVSEPTRDFPAFLTYVTFWPQLIAGPILRAKEVIPQLLGKRVIDGRALGSGALWVLIGLFKKVVLADTIAPMVDEAFEIDPAKLTALDVWVSTFLFGFQIYFDFSGYSDIAIGSAKMLGISFPANFRWPYLAVSPRDFWSRWHISLSSWIRDYLYLPLSGAQFKTDSTGGLGTEGAAGFRTRALFLTWGIMGLWHGAAWTFALWGLYHAALIYLYRVVKPLRDLPERWPSIAWTLMLLLGMAGWVPFRASSVGDSLILFAHLVNPFDYVFSGRALAGASYVAAAGLLVGMLALSGGKWLWQRNPRLSRAEPILTVAAVAGMTLMIVALLRPVRQFIYFQF